jgi:porphobilinogen synthase
MQHMLLQQRPTSTLQLTRRPRRNRRLPAIRSLVQETVLQASDLVMPYFLMEGEGRQVEIPSMPGIFRMTLDEAMRDIEQIHARGIQGVILFPVVPEEKKDERGSYGLQEEAILPRALEELRKAFPSLCLIADLALDPFSCFGHDGIVGVDGLILNDETVEQLCAIALLYAQKGADYIAPSDMMDGRVGAIRKRLDEASYTDTGIISYCAKYASSLYAPFRQALDSAPRFGDKFTYQLHPANAREALIEAELDMEEGADILMVKPALFYLDVLAKLKAQFPLPLSAFHVSGEYSMVVAADRLGFLDAQKVFYEALLSIKRAGADFIYTYAARDILPLL